MPRPRPLLASMAAIRLRFKTPHKLHWLKTVPRNKNRKTGYFKYLCGLDITTFHFTRNAEMVSCAHCARLLNDDIQAKTQNQAEPEALAARSA